LTVNLTALGLVAAVLVCGNIVVLALEKLGA
jgi:hypothetical protein